MNEIISPTEIMDIAVKAIHDKISERLGNGYDSPLNKIIDDVVVAHAAQISSVVSECLEETLGTKEFKKAVKTEFSHKIAKSLVAKLEGTVERAVEKMRQDQTLRARLVLAIENIIKENETPLA